MSVRVIDRLAEPVEETVERRYVSGKGEYDPERQARVERLRSWYAMTGWVPTKQSGTRKK